MERPVDGLWATFVFALGACVGSFLNVVVWRLPRGESIVFPASHCPKCGRAIQAYDNIPILSWLLLRGRCRYCKTWISPRYLLIESATAAIFLGLYLAYYVWDIRPGMGDFLDTWPIYAAHVALLSGLLACSLIDIETFHVPLEICWFVSIVGVVCAAACPNDAILPFVSPATGSACLGAGAGLILSAILQRRGVLIPSFIDATAPVGADGEARDDGHQVAVTRACGVNPRVEVLREVLYLLPAIVLATAGGLLHRHCAGYREGFDGLLGWTGATGPFVRSAFGALFGYLIGGLWIWGIRIFGTLGFGKEAMGLGDVHILAAAGAVCGWVVPSIAFFIAPLAGLLWALYLLARKGQRELPYGPWLSVGVAVVMICYRPIGRLFDAYLELAGLK